MQISDIATPTRLRTCERSLALAGWLLVVCVGSLAVDGSTPCLAGNASALSAIFGEDGLSDPSGISDRAMQLAPEERFALLNRYVLPEGDRTRIRVDFDFVSVESSDDDARQSPIESPALLLVETAHKLDRLALLKRQLADRVVSDSQRRNRSVLNVLIALHERDFNSARAGLTEIFEAASNASVIPAERAPEAIAISSAMQFPETVEAAQDLAFLIYEQARNKRGPRSERWHRYSYAMKHLLQWHADHAGKSPDDSGTLTPDTVARSVNSSARQWQLANWHAVSRATAETTGDGYPAAAWSFEDGQVGHVTCHDHDYLYYRIPLAGNFDIEADTTTFGYRDIHLAVGGIYAGPGYDLKGCLHGNFRHDSPTFPITPPLTAVQDWMRVRIRVRDGQRTSFVNGRDVFRYAHSGDPWLAIHSPWYANGSVKNLRITGDITVPAEIDLLTHSDLTGWLTYYKETAGGTYGDWQLRRVSPAQPGGADATTEVVELVGQRSKAPASSFNESLLCYHRPMIEDGVISYEFYYEPGLASVSPALGRAAFLIARDGVREHTITNGLYERRGLSPQATTAPLVRVSAPLVRDSAPLIRDSVPLIRDSVPLKVGDWNHVELLLAGDELRLHVNGQLVHQRLIHDSQSRHFGLFHYSDQTEARVRRLRWRGDWPKSVPALSEQELAGDEVDSINAELADLPATFRYDFANGLDAKIFTVAGRDWQQHVAATETGLHVTQPGADGYPNTAIAPLLQVHGDFDIVAEFENFEMKFDSPGDANLQLFVGLNDVDANECRLYRRGEASASGSIKQLLQPSLFTGPPGQRRYLFHDRTAEEARSGRLRFARRDDTVYYMFAELDSQSYRLIHTQKASTAETPGAGLRLVIETQKAGLSSVLWKSLTVRADSLSGPATLPRQSIVELNVGRELLKAQQSFDFTRTESLEPFVIWGDKSSLQRTATGLMVTAPGTEEWQATGLASRVHIEGDFDVTLNFDVLKFDQPVSGNDSTIYLEADFDEDSKKAIQIKLVRYPEGLTVVSTGIRQLNASGNPESRELSGRSVTGATLLRIARRGSVASLIFRDAVTQKDVIVTQTDVGTAPLPAWFLRALVHTGGADRQTIVRFKSLSIHADQLRPDTDPRK